MRSALTLSGQRDSRQSQRQGKSWACVPLCFQRLPVPSLRLRLFNSAFAEEGGAGCVGARRQVSLTFPECREPAGNWQRLSSRHVHLWLAAGRASRQTSGEPSLCGSTVPAAAQGSGWQGKGKWGGFLSRSEEDTGCFRARFRWESARSAGLRHGVRSAMILTPPLEFPVLRASAMRPSGGPSSHCLCSRLGRAPWMWWALTALGCFAGSAWSSYPERVPGAPLASLSHPGLRGLGVPPPHPPALSVYRSPASLRGGHGESAPACLPARPKMQRWEGRAGSYAPSFQLLSTPPYPPSPPSLNHTETGCS